MDFTGTTVARGAKKATHKELSSSMSHRENLVKNNFFKSLAKSPVL